MLPIPTNHDSLIGTRTRILRRKNQPGETACPRGKQAVRLGQGGKKGLTSPPPPSGPQRSPSPLQSGAGPGGVAPGGGGRGPGLRGGAALRRAGAARLRRGAALRVPPAADVVRPRGQGPARSPAPPPWHEPRLGADGRVGSEGRRSGASPARSGGRGLGGAGSQALRCARAGGWRCQPMLL